jgi:hypothetical protein
LSSTTLRLLGPLLCRRLSGRVFTRARSAGYSGTRSASKASEFAANPNQVCQRFRASDRQVNAGLRPRHHLQLARKLQRGGNCQFGVVIWLERQNASYYVRRGLLLRARQTSEWLRRFDLGGRRIFSDDKSKHLLASGTFVARSLRSSY